MRWESFSQRASFYHLRLLCCFYVFLLAIFREVSTAALVKNFHGDEREFYSMYFALSLKITLLGGEILFSQAACCL